MSKFILTESRCALKASAESTPLQTGDLYVIACIHQKMLRVDFPRNKIYIEFRAGRYNQCCTNRNSYS